MPLVGFAEAQLNTLATIDKAKLERQLAKFSRNERDRLIQEGRASPEYQTFVNGREGGSEDDVRYPGPIVYKFAILKQVAQLALTYLRQVAPDRSGRYRDSFFLMVDGDIVDGPDAISVTAQSFTVTNDQPYARKIQVGAKGFTVYAHLFDHAAIAVRQKWGPSVSANVAFLQLEGGYSLKRDSFRVTKQGVKKIRSDAKAGSGLNYPALVVTRL